MHFRAFLSHQQEKPWGRVLIPAYQLKPLWLQCVFTHDGNGIGEAFGPLTNAEPSAKAKKLFGGSADVVQRTHRLMPCKLLGGPGA